MKRCFSIFIVFLLIFSLANVSFVAAQEEAEDPVADNFESDGDVVDEESHDDEEDLDDISDEEIDEELGDGGSVNGFDRFIDGIFQDDLDNMRERFAEVRTLIRNGEVDEARELLEHYREVADNLENEVSPDERDEAVRLSRVIRSAIRDLRDQIPEDARDDFDDASERAEDVGTAAEIASQIRDLCNQLHDQGAWDQFEQVCKTDDEGPRWQRDYFDDLSDEQREEAEAFVDGIGACMRDPSSRECNCDVANEEFKLLCEEIVEAEMACRDGNEDACEVADRAGGDVYESLRDLPHLRRALQKLDQNFEDAHEERFDDHIPQVCRDAHERGEIDLFGPNGREECFPLAVRERAPGPCIDALERGDLPDDDEFGFRSGCKDIMGDQGFDDHGEFDDRRGPPGNAPALGLRCQGIEDGDERLRCFDEEFTRSREHFDERYDERRQRFEDRRDSFRDFEATCPLKEREECLSGGGRWDCRNGFVECFEGEFDDFGPRDFDDHDRRERRDIGRDRFREEDHGPRCPPGEVMECPTDNPNDCICRGFDGRDHPEEFEDFDRPEDFDDEHFNGELGSQGPFPSDSDDFDNSDDFNDGEVHDSGDDSQDNSGEGSHDSGSDGDGGSDGGDNGNSGDGGGESSGSGDEE